MSAPSKGTALLALLTQYADNGWVCPSLPGLAKLTGINQSTVGEYLRRLRKARKITQRIIHVAPHGRARVVTITATGKSTATPAPSRRQKPERPPFTPTENALTTAGRRLEGEEFKRRAAELMARDAEDRRRQERWGRATRPTRTASDSARRMENVFASPHQTASRDSR